MRLGRPVVGNREVAFRSTIATSHAVRRDEARFGLTETRKRFGSRSRSPVTPASTTFEKKSARSISSNSFVRLHSKTFQHHL